MKGRFTLVFSLAVLAVTGILLFQLYWVYNSYRTEQRNFDDKIAVILQKSIDVYAAQAFAMPQTLKENEPYLSVMQSYDDDSAGRRDTGRRVLRNVMLKSLQVEPDNLITVRGMIARLSMQAFNKPIQLTVLDTIFRRELQKNQVELDFRLVVKSGQTMPEAIFPGKRQYLFRRTVVPALVSVLLILLSVGSLFYMGMIIRRLVRLDGSKDAFINNIAHELRTPIAILKSTHEALYTFRGDADPDKLRRYLEINSGVLDRLDTNVDRLLDSMNYEQGNRKPALEPVDLSALAGKVIQRLDPEGKIGVVLESGMEQAEVVTDPYIIETVLTNLIDNAIKYAGGRREVGVGAGDDGDTRVGVGKVVVRIDGGGGVGVGAGWQLQVRDQGPGIASEHLPFIFDKFYRVPAGDLHEVKGYGIGLSYVRQLVTTLGGRIGVKSAPGQGTEFTIQFPQHG
jgi:two-component system, OmpR family, phosphate regulon sensor histidine kinase PhoR